MIIISLPLFFQVSHTKPPPSFYLDVSCPYLWSCQSWPSFVSSLFWHFEIVKYGLGCSPNIFIKVWLVISLWKCWSKTSCTIIKPEHLTCYNTLQKLCLPLITSIHAFISTFRTYVENTSKQVQKERKVTENQRRCRMVPFKLPDKHVVVPVTR